jgi:hypothetical protein
MAKIDVIECKKCKQKFRVFIPDKSKWTKCPFCEEMNKHS